MVAEKRRRWGWYLVGLYFLLLVAYLAIAWWFHAPRGYYGTTEQPRFADPWLARSETILSGGLLYRDVFTATPPLTNYLLIIPSLVADWVGYINPWTTLAFMLFFSVFNLFAALVLLHAADSPAEGFTAAALFLLNPLTFGNAVLRRQDESIMTFFLGLALLLLVRRRHLAAAVSIGGALLIKLTGAILIPVGFLNSRDWRYLVVPLLVFVVVFSPFLILAGRDAMFWDFGQQDTQHPFQLGGVSLAALWNRWHADSYQIPVSWLSAVLLVGAILAGALVFWFQFGVWADVSLLLAVVFLLTPKLHTGYYSLLAFTLAPLVKRHRLVAVYMAFGALAVVADFFKWPIEDFRVAFWLMLVVYGLLAFMALQLVRLLRRPRW